MEALILCGGLGTRLREETEFRPKPMINIGEKPILWHIMKRYSAYGVKRFILCLGYKGNMIRDYFLTYRFFGSDFTVNLENGSIEVDSEASTEPWEIVLVETGLHNYTASRIAQAMKHIKGERFFATYGDGVADIDLESLLEFHMMSKKPATLTAVNPPSRFGEIVIENDSVEVFAEKPQIGKGLINGGFFVFEKELLAPYLPKDPLHKDTKLSLESHILEALCQDKNLAAYQHDGFWQCMDTMREMDILNTIYYEGNPPWLMVKDQLIPGTANVSL